MDSLLSQVENGFRTLSVNEKFKQQALRSIKIWLTEAEFSDYVPQIKHLIQNEYWDYLLDSFYQVIPFGTGGRRGEVGVGPNRINPWTIKSSAQGHSQFLLKIYHDAAKTRGVVLAYDVREFFGNKFLSDDLPNPVKNLTSKDLAHAAAIVYAGNGIKVFIFDKVRTTPELSFAIRYLKAVGGDMFSASHNPPDHNGKKVYDEYGGQLVPPDDEKLVNEVTKNVSKVHEISFKQGEDEKLIQILGPEIDEAYIKNASDISLSKSRDIKIVYSALHGTGSTSVVKALQNLGFEVLEDPATTHPSGKFENITFNIPNPEVEQSFETPLKFAKEKEADILLSTDPDADRIGAMVKHQKDWIFLNGNEIAAILTEYVVKKRKPTLKGQGVVIKTAVTTDLIREICITHDIKLIGDLLVGFKYIAEQMNKLEKDQEIENFLIGSEESHGYIAGNYLRDKDAVIAAVWLSELAAEQKEIGNTLVDYLNQVYSKYGYFRNYLTEIRIPGAEGKSQIDKLQDALRKSPPSKIGEFEVKEIIDYQNNKPIVSETDMISKNKLTFYFLPLPNTTSIKVTVRPSGTEPKIKMYFEIGSKPFDLREIKQVKSETEEILKTLEKAFMKYCYKILGIDFPDRGFLLFWQLPLDKKLKYFQIEDSIVKLKDEKDQNVRFEKLNTILSFLGSDPIQKVDAAFKDKYQQSIKDFLDLTNP